MSELTIRPVTADDLGAVNDIYNEAVRTTVATFDVEPRTMEERRVWFAGHGPRHPVLAAQCGGSVVGWASLSKWSDRGAYADTVEVSLYIAEAHRGRGIGRRLLEAVIEEGRRAGLHAVIAQIVGGNEVSIHLHRAMGFEHVGVLREVGRKFGRLLDVCIMQKVYGDER